ncbi:MAG TPA: hypothetical protein VG322_17950 [Candidatus Acidoferrales bacterium]|jgi:hypothetical protein|nr:hypothetical protein [Candidatus Acidoferrales bacterium]
MPESSSEEREIYEFVWDEIDSVPHLEALLLLWNSKPKSWSAQEVGRRLYVDAKKTQALLQDLARQRFLVVLPGDAEQYRYESRSEQTDRRIGTLDHIYRRQVVRISTIIHSKASSAVRDFARAFRFTREREKERE